MEVTDVFINVVSCVLGWRRSQDHAQGWPSVFPNWCYWLWNVMYWCTCFSLKWVKWRSSSGDAIRYGNSSGVPRISAWEGSRRRGGGCGEGVSLSPLGKGSGEGAVSPPQNFFCIFGRKCCILTHSVWLKYQQKVLPRQWGGSNLPIPLLYATG